MKFLILVFSGILLGSSGIFAETETVAAATFNIRTLRGVTYQNCRITNSTPAYITVIHDGGVARIKFENLTRSWQQKFNYDATKAASFMLQEAEVRREKEAAYKDLVAKQVRQEEQRLSALAEREEASRRPFPALIPFPGDDANRINAPVIVEDNVIPDSPMLGAAYTPGKGYGRSRRSGWSTSSYLFTNPYLPYYPVWNVPYSNYHYCPPPVYHHPYSSPQIWMGPPTIRITR